jgi:hypothetical protein
VTKPRMFPDRPRTCADTRAWAVAAKAAGASIWQVAVFVQRQPDTLYRVIARAADAARAAEGVRKRRKRPPGKSVRDVNRALRARLRLEAKAMTFRCACGGRSTDRDGHPACLAA